MASHNTFQILSSFEQQLKDASVDSPRLCAEMIVGEVTGMSRAQLLAFGERKLDAAQMEWAKAMLSRRVQGEPMAYILGRKEFYGREFKVNPAVLVPRPETELIVDLALEFFQKTAPLRFADLGCGSGCILGTLLAEAGAWKGIGVDISPAALAVARENLERLQVQGRAELLEADFAEPAVLPGAALDLLVSNPPYIPTVEYEALGFEVKNFEPRLALDSGPDGLVHPRMVAATAAYALKPGGLLLMEIGTEQGKGALALFHNSAGPFAWRALEIIPDLAGRNRLVRAVRG